MGTATMATALGAAMVLYYVLNKRMAAGKDGAGGGAGGNAGTGGPRMRRRRSARRPPQPPSTWLEAVATLAETLRFTYSETLGKWPIGDLAFGIKYLMRRQGNVYAASVYAGSDSVELEGHEIMMELILFQRLIDLCYLFSKRPFPSFLELTGFTPEEVLVQEPKAGILKPAHTILRDQRSKCFLVLVRGTHSIKDTLTAATGAAVPFHHSLLDEGGVSKLVLGYAHCGMVAAARWIAKGITSSLLKAVNEYPDYKIKIVGHSLGGGTAALLTYILREHKEFSSTTCVAFAPAACMTWDLAESGKQFITSIINGTDLVPTVSTASVDDLRAEVTASSWLNDLRDQLQQTRFLNVVYRSASALGSRLQSISSARERVAGAEALFRPVSNRTLVVVRQAQNVARVVARSQSALSSWSCMGARRRLGMALVPKDASSTETRSESKAGPESFVVEQSAEIVITGPVSAHDEAEEEHLLSETEHEVTIIESNEEMTESEMWSELEHQLGRQPNADVEAHDSEALIVEEITEVEEDATSAAMVSADRQSVSSDPGEVHQLYPPGRILHMVTLPPASSAGASPGPDECVSGCEEREFRIYEPPRNLYSKIRLSKDMINDHYMPVYKRAMGALIEKFAATDEEEGDEEGDASGNANSGGTESKELLVT